MGVSTPRTRGGHSTTPGLCERAVNQERHGEDSVPCLGPSQGSEPPKGRRPVDPGGRESEGRRPGAHGCLTDLEPTVRVPSGLVWFLPRRLFLACGFSPCPHVASPLGAVKTQLWSLALLLSPQPCLMAYGVLVHQPGTEPGPSALKAPRPSHGTARQPSLALFL